MAIVKQEAEGEDSLDFKHWIIRQGDVKKDIDGVLIHFVDLVIDIKGHTVIRNVIGIITVAWDLLVM